MNDTIIRSAAQLEAAIAKQRTVVTDNPIQAGVVADILNERGRQDEKWGPVPRIEHDFGKWLTILAEEIGEASEAELEAKADSQPASFMPWSEQVDIELVQAAATILAWLEHRAIISKGGVR